MQDTPELTAEIEETLREYVAIQEREQTIKEEKAALQEKLKAHMSQGGARVWRVTAAGRPLKVQYSRKTEIQYDEDKLSQRLGDRYARILSPSMRKIKGALPRLAELLAPVLTEIGAPDPLKVRAAIDGGVVTREEFADAFSKQTKEMVVVMRDRDAPSC